MLPPLSTSRYSYLLLSWGIVDKTKMSKLWNSSRGDFNPGSLDWESGVLPLSYRAPLNVYNCVKFSRSCSSTVYLCAFWSCIILGGFFPRFWREVNIGSWEISQEILYSGNFDETINNTDDVRLCARTRGNIRLSVGNSCYGYELWLWQKPRRRRRCYNNGDENKIYNHAHSPKTHHQRCSSRRPRCYRGTSSPATPDPRRAGRGRHRSPPLRRLRRGIGTPCCISLESQRWWEEWATCLQQGAAASVVVGCLQGLCRARVER